MTATLSPMRVLHAGPAAHEVPLEAEVVVDPAVDPLEGGAPPIAPEPGRAALRGRREDPPVVPRQRDAHDPPVWAGRVPGAAVAARSARADLAPGGRRTAILQRRAPGLEALERHRPLGSGLGADATHLALLRVHDPVRPPGIEGARGVLHRRRAGPRRRVRPLFPPQVPGRDQGGGSATCPTDPSRVLGRSSRSGDCEARLGGRRWPGGLDGQGFGSDLDRGGERVRAKLALGWQGLNGESGRSGWMRCLPLMSAGDRRPVGWPH